VGKGFSFDICNVRSLYRSRPLTTVSRELARCRFCRNWGRMPRMQVAGDICLRRPRPTQGCRADDDDDDDDEIRLNLVGV